MIKSSYFRANHGNRFEKKFFIDEKLQTNIQKFGYVVIDLLNQSEVDSLYKGFLNIKKALNNDFGENFWPSGRSSNISIRNLAKNYIDEVLPNKLSPLFYNNQYEFIGGTYLIKPPSNKSELSPHQDSSHVLEKETFSVYCWIPLQDVDENNGCFHVIPQSHHLKIEQRSLNVPWVLKDHTNILNKYMTAIKMKAGQAIFFDASLIHASPSNFSDSARVAVNYYIHRKEHPFCHYYYNEEIDKVEVFNVTPSFYYDEDFEKRPSKKYELIETQDLSIKQLSKNELIAICEDLNNNKLKSLYFLAKHKLFI